MSLEQIEWFAALDEGNVKKLKDLLVSNLALLEERNENQVTIFTRFAKCRLYLVLNKSLILSRIGFCYDRFCRIITLNHSYI